MPHELVRPGRSAPAHARTDERRTRRPLVKRALTIVFFSVVAWVLIDRARTLDWPAVFRAIHAYPMRTLALAAGLAAASHAVYCGYDLIGRHYTGHRLPARQVAAVGFVSYAFNLNLGSLVGAFAMRYRLYARLGLSVDTTSRILALSMLTNWLGYFCVAGVVCLWAPLRLPPGWRIGEAALPVIGVVALAAVSAYVLACFRAKRRDWSVRGHHVTLPNGRVALVQLAIASLNWSLIGSVVFVLLQGRVDYASALSALLIAAVAGLLTHIPAGLGVLEAVYLALLSQRIGANDVLAAVLTYRAIYYLAPLALAAVLYVVLEARAAQQRTALTDGPTAGEGPADGRHWHT